MFNLEDDLPDELVSNANNWSDTPLGGNKPTTQVTGPPNQLNGEDIQNVNVLQRQLHPQQLHHMLQQQQQVSA